VASKYNRTVYESWELAYKEIQQRAKSDDSCRANAASSAMLLLELFSFFHHEGITEEIFSYAAIPENDETPMSNLPLASSLLDRRLLPLHGMGTWDNFIFREGIRILLSFFLIRRGHSDNVYAMHPLVHTWGRDRLTVDEREKCCLMACVTLSCSVRWDADQPCGFQRTLVTHARANMEYLKSQGNQNIISYMDDAYAKFGRLLWEQGYSKKAEIFEIKVLDERNKILGVEHAATISAMGNLAQTYHHLGKYIEAEKLEIHVLDARNRIIGVEHPNTILTMGNLACTYGKLGKYTEAEKLEIQVLDARNRILGVEHPDMLGCHDTVIPLCTFSLFHVFFIPLATRTLLYKPIVSLWSPQSVITETEVSHPFLYLRSVLLTVPSLLHRYLGFRFYRLWAYSHA
jgi:tetratricopeptide (TPR) repeat protein